VVANPDRFGDLRVPYCGGVLFIDRAHAHVFGVLPWLLILACPLMHLFMHHGHHGGHGQVPRSNPDDEAEQGR
jgi:Protein of unknown function (DUF2933)